jgi:hypothetical protein
MNNQYSFLLLITDPDGKTARRSFAIDAFQAPQLKPYDLCSDPTTAMLADGVTDRGAARIDCERKNLIKEVALKLANSILHEIKSADTRNGYSQ